MALTVWIEAENAEDGYVGWGDRQNRPKISTYRDPLASGGTIVTSCQTPGAWASFHLPVEQDGLFELDVWVRYATISPGTVARFSVNGKVIGEPEFPETETFFAPYSWLKVGSAQLPKGLHELRIEWVSGILHYDCFVVTDEADYVPSGRADAVIRGEAQERPEEEAGQLPVLWVADRPRSGAPLGGLGAGKVEICPDGVLTNITTNNNQDWPFMNVPGAFFAYSDGQEARLLQKEERYGLDGVNEVPFDGGFPVARLGFRDPALKGNVRLTAFGSLVPQDLERSSMPLALFRFEVRNPASETLPAALAFSWENLIGCGGWPLERPDAGEDAVSWNRGQVWQNRAGNGAERCALTGGSGLRMSSDSDHGRPLTHGEYVLACTDSDAEVAEWDAGDKDAAWSGFAEVRMPQQVASAPRPAGAICARRTIEPGETWTVWLALAWHFPHLTDAEGNPDGLYYTQRFGSAAEVAEFGLAHRDELLAATLELENALGAGSLPHWQTRKLMDDLFPMVSCSWFVEDGRFSINEAPTGMGGCLGTLDQRNASNCPYTLLFPRLDRRELLLFSGREGENGSMAHDLGRAGFVREKGGVWPDLSSAFVLECARYLKFTGDRDFFERVYPTVVRTLAWQASTDDDGDGIPDLKAGRGTTYDTYHWFGASAFVASLYSAALVEGAWMAELAGDAALADQYRAARERVRDAAERRLWTGEYYRNYNDDIAGERVSENCNIAQLAGEWYADMGGAGPMWPAEHVDSSLRRIFALNVEPWLAPADEVQPDGEPSYQGYCFIQYAEVYFGCTAIRRGLVEEGLRVFEQARRASYEIGKHPWKTYLCYFAKNGRGTGLCWYMTNPASWYLLEARSGFSVDAFDRTLRLGPRFLPGEKELSVPLFHPAGWLLATFSRSKNGTRVELTPRKVINPGGLRFDMLEWSPAPDIRERREGRLDLSRPVSLEMP